ncbi:hypothetical protein [Stenotrophomonas acidaminiphila]|uniref:phage tail tube protein n=1 Tax=Stenotrophomonas acidaminiphila TaxID=128780 RepID=UPI0015F611AF|nr:hypothetical protein [Stenotrophomonas acidaminiphila]
MSTVTKYYSLQGRVSFFTRLPNGKKGVGVWAQNVPKFDLSFEVNEESTKESHSGQRLKDLVFEIEKAMKTAFTLNGFTLDNLARGLWASRYTVASGTVSGEPLPADLAVGDYFALEKQNTSDWSLVDSTVSAAVPLVEGTHYALVSAFAGHGQLLNVTGLTLPILASYSNAASNALSLLSMRPDDHWLVFDGIDTISKARAYLEISRHTSKPTGSLPLINNEGKGSMDLEGEALYDGAAPDFPLGKFVLGAA